MGKWCLGVGGRRVRGNKAQGKVQEEEYKAGTEPHTRQAYRQRQNGIHKAGRHGITEGRTEGTAAARQEGWAMGFRRPACQDKPEPNPGHKKRPSRSPTTPHRAGKGKGAGKARKKAIRQGKGVAFILQVG